MNRESHILFLAAGFLSLWAAASCSKSETPADQDDEGQPLSFASYSKQADSRSDGSLVTGTTLPDGKSFGIYAYRTTESFDATDSPKPNYMADVKVTYNGQGSEDGENYEYSPLRYWPKDGSLLTFWAYYPCDASGILVKPTKDTTGLGTIKYTVSTDTTKQSDLMVSKLCKDITYDNSKAQTGSNADGTVKLAFQHALSLITFSAKVIPDDQIESVTISKLSVSHVLTTGTLSHEDNILSWKIAPTDSTYADYELIGNSPKALDATGSKAVTLGNELMLPQSIDNGNVLAQLTYTIKLKTGQIITESPYFQLRNSNKKEDPEWDPVTKWEANQHVNYTISLGVSFIDFTVSLKDWVEQPDRDISIQ